MSGWRPRTAARLCGVLGLPLRGAAAHPLDQHARDLAHERDAARAAGDYERSDAIRRELVALGWRGRGIGRQMGEHSLQMARVLGYKAMQFNFVAASNRVAIHLWQKLGFRVVGRLPKAFCHPRLGYIDALVMYQWLAD
ncbi:MAG: GNAT family N-acetyltransferase [Gloeomargarita sp. GMQP_bins_5]